MRVLFVCTGNTCRSPMAEGYFKHLCEKAGKKEISVSSAGTHAPLGRFPSDEAIAVMRDEGIDISQHRSVPLDAQMLELADLIVCMSSAHRFHVGSIKASAMKKTRLILEFADKKEQDLGDPFGGNKQLYAYCFHEMKGSLENLLLDLGKTDEQ